jgi:diguanylate cyclase (GGDEF)-like protein
MRVRSFALAYTIGLALLAIGSATILWSRDWDRLSEVERGGDVIDLLRPAIKFVETLALERGVYNQVLVAKTTAPEESRRLVAERNVATDALFDEVLRKAKALSPSQRGQIVESTTEAWSIIRAARVEAAPFLANDAPASPDAARTLVAEFVKAGDEIDDAIGTTDRGLYGVDPSLGMMLEIAKLSNDIREQAGLRSALLSRFAGTLKPFSVSERIQTAEAAGAMRISWSRLQRIAGEVGGADIENAVASVNSEFFEKGEPVYIAMTDAARDGSRPPMDFPSWRKWTNGTLTKSLLARDAPLNQAARRVVELRAEALRSFALGFAGLVGLFVLLAAAVALIELRVLRPIGRLTQMLGDRSSSEDDRSSLENEARDFALRYGNRDDEIGSLARAVVRFRRYANELVNLNHRFDAVLANLPQGVSFYDEDDRLVVANRRYSELYGLDPGVLLIGKTLSSVVALRALAAGQPIVGADDGLRDPLHAMREGGVARRTCELPDGRVISLNGVRMPGGGWLATHLDVTERRRTEAQIAFMADHDSLTGLANRHLLSRRMKIALDRVQRGGRIAVMCLDLDRFKAVNDTLGHGHGDELLRQVAQRLKDCIRPGDTAARLGGDEFAIVVEVADADPTVLVQRLLDAVSQPYDLDGYRPVVGVSIGVAIGPQDGATSHELLKAADLAMYRAKLDGRGAYRFYEAAMDASMQLRRLLELDLRTALRNNELKLHYQPILTLRSNDISCFEALLRWNHPLRGVISPSDFIPVAEESGLIVDIGEWVLRQACADAAAWSRPVKVSVNISPRQFIGDRLMADVTRALNAATLPASRLELEITENAMLSNTDSTIEALRQLHELGVSIAMDDFGTGYSSLSYLRRFPIDKIKIDQVFIRDLSCDSASVSIIRAITELASGLGMSTTAEGVETKDQFDLLRAEGCTEIQGYYVSAAVPSDRVDGLLDRGFAGRSAA